LLCALLCFVETETGTCDVLPRAGAWEGSYPASACSIFMEITRCIHVYVLRYIFICVYLTL
jgi:hypothetical protein